MDQLTTSHFYIYSIFADVGNADLRFFSLPIPAMTAYDELRNIDAATYLRMWTMVKLSGQFTIVE